MNIIGIILAILAFGVLIIIHELAHFTAARIFKVGINEFSIGMGPKLFSRVSKKSGTAYSLRLFPIGGFVSMVGEDEESDSDSAFCNKAAWKRFIIVAAGAITNILAGFIIMFFIILSQNKFYSSEIVAFARPVNEISAYDGEENYEGYSDKATEYHDTTNTYEYYHEYEGLKSGDVILKINDSSINIYDDLSSAIMFDGAKPVTVTVLRNGEEKTIDNVLFETSSEQGVTYGIINICPASDEMSFSMMLKQAVYKPFSIMKVIYRSFVELISGSYGMEAVSGPVGAVSTISTVAKEAISEQNYSYIFTIMVFLTMNLGIFNLFPLPALDGGRLLFILIEMIFRRPVNRKVEGIIHTVGILLLFAFMAYITVFDIMKLI